MSVLIYLRCFVAKLVCALRGIAKDLQGTAEKITQAHTHMNVLRVMELAREAIIQWWMVRNWWDSKTGAVRYDNSSALVADDVELIRV